MRRRLPLLALGLAGTAVVLGMTGVPFGGGLSSLRRRFEAWTLRPRVLVGGETFETVDVFDRSSVRQAGDFDGEPGDELAIIEYGTVQFLTPATLAERQRVELGSEMRARWRPSSRLARVSGRLVVVETGGGLDDTQIRDLDGTERWRYRPDADVPATSLVPADLDGDGDTEYYAAISSHSVRLDASGQEVWRAQFPGGRLVATAPRTRRDPAWIVAEGQGTTVVWDASGTRLASVTMKDARPLAVIDWPDGRYVLAGGPAVRAIGLDGRVAFEWAVEGMTISAAVPVALEGGAPRAIALVASGERGLGRWRLQIVSRDRTLLYDEILDTPTELLTARGADGVERLFLDRASLLALRRRTE